MNSIDIDVIRTALDWLDRGQRVVLGTVVRTWGSAPRPPGSLMIIRDDGQVAGSLSGGCIEDDLIVRVRQGELAARPTEILTYGVSREEAARFGLPCGGTLELLLEYDPDAQALQDLVRALEGGQLMRRTVRLADGAVTQVPADAPQELSVSDTELVNTFGPEYRMLLIGAGQLTEYLATMALFNGFAVTVCDPREEYRGAWSVPAARVVADMPDDVVTAFKPDRRSCVVALTHDPKLDDLALLEALGSPAFYVGAIGSRRNHHQRHARLIEHFGHSEESLKDLRGPIGIYIGSKTPAEIAVSVMAEVLAVKNGVPLPRDLEVAVAKARAGLMLSQTEDPMACGLPT